MYKHKIEKEVLSAVDPIFRMTRLGVKPLIHQLSRHDMEELGPVDRWLQPVEALSRSVNHNEFHIKKMEG